MPIGYMVSVLVIAGGILLGLRPLSRSGLLGRISFFLSAGVNESPFLGLYLLFGVTSLAYAQDDLDTPMAWFALALACATVFTIPILVREASGRVR